MSIKLILPLLFFTISGTALVAQKKGCTDIQATNYDSSANFNDGSCTYPATAYSPKAICPKLSDTLIETSGLIYFNNWFWTQNDSGNEPQIYAFDSMSGKIIHRIIISNKTNTDWEEITQDATNIYIGEFGNNLGNRTDLKIYIIKKSGLNFNRPTDTVNATEILFNYADQSSFVSNNQNHNYDMEAMCIWKDSIHLFSKNWADMKTRHYVMPKVAGIYTLTPRETMNAEGQITSACTNLSGDKIILGGYNKSNGACFMWMLWDYKDNMFFNGNKRKIDLGSALTLGQFEASTFKTNQLYFTNEKKFTEAGLWSAEISQWFTKSNYSRLNKIKTVSKFVAYQKDSELVIETKNTGGYIYIYNSSGVKIVSQKIRNETTVFPIGRFNSGIYTIEVNGNVQKILIEL